MKGKYIYIYVVIPGGRCSPDLSHPGGLRPPNPLHHWGCALKPLHPGELRSQDRPHLGGCAPKALQPRRLRPPDAPLGRTDGRAGGERTSRVTFFRPQAPGGIPSFVVKFHVECSEKTCLESPWGMSYEHISKDMYLCKG